MILWLLLLGTLFCESAQDGNGQENGVLHCGPQNMTLDNSDQTILLTWEDDPSCSAVHDTLTYELVVLIADMQYDHEVAATPDQRGSTHFWNWTSPWDLEFVSPSVRLRSRYKNHTSPWKQEKTLQRKEDSKKPGVYPREGYFEVGSTVTLYCVLPEGQSFDKMSLTGYNGTVNTTKITNRIYALTALLNHPSVYSCTDVKCRSTSKQHHTPPKKSEIGACINIGYPPDDKDLTCETQDLKSVVCHWTVGRATHLPTTEYELLKSQCTHPGRCSQKVRVEAGERNWTLTAKNKVGKVELSDKADLTKRVYMIAPKKVAASAVNARNVSLEWEWEVEQYNNLNITCQVNISHGGRNAMSEDFGVGLNSAVLTDLIPNWTYNVTVRCGTAQHFWRWSDWSTIFNFHTKDDVPDALDVWTHMKENETVIFWKMPLANQSHGDIIDYEVTWATTTETEPNRSNVAHNTTQLALSLNATKEYIVTVTARNIKGNSYPSAITIPSFNADTTGVNTSWITGRNGSLSLTWSTSPSASCGYIVDWCPTSGHCNIEWLKVPPYQTYASIFSKNFKDGLRYSLSIYACTAGAPVLLERREGYVREQRIQGHLFNTRKWEQQDSNVEVSWAPISLSEQTAFIQGYILYWWDENNNNIVFNVSTDNPEATSLTARNLKIGSYTFKLQAQTAVGECGTDDFSVTLNSLTGISIKVVVISLVAIFSLLSLITVLCYKHWTCIKQKVYPPIPKPLLTDNWLTSPGEYKRHPLHVHPCHHSEAEIMAIPELHHKSGVPVDGYVSHTNIPFVFSQTPKGYYNQPLKKCSPPPLILPATVPSQSGLPSSQFRCLFPNPSYNLIMQTGNQQSNSGPEPQERTCLERSSSGYQPQSHTATYTLNHTEEDSDSHMTCVSTYILLPQSPSK